MSGLCKDCKYYEPFSVYWEEEKRMWTDAATEEGERAGLEEFDEVAEYARAEHWKLRRWGRCLLTETSSGSLEHPGSKAGALDLDNYSASLRCAPDFGCVQFERALGNEN